MEKFRILRTACIVFVVCAATAIASPARTFTSLVSFNGANGWQPFGGVIQGTDGNFYGTTSIGGAKNDGTVFKITAEGTLTTLYSFCSQTNCADGWEPIGALVQGTDGNFYGTTYLGGANSGGTVFKITPGGTLTTLYSFCSQTNCTDGFYPYAGLIQAADGNFYGATLYGGAKNVGTVFKISAAGTLTTLYSFCSQTNCTDGSSPRAGLIQATDGNFYGTTQGGGVNGGGTVFNISSAGTLTTLYSFCSQTSCTDGTEPYAGLIQAADGNFYGTTFSGGANSSGCGGVGCGTAFKITPSGALTTLYSFCSQTNCTDGAEPYAGLIQAGDGNFYGTTYGGGTKTAGTVFKTTPGGALTTLYNFCSKTNCTDGASPTAGLFLAADGSLYGTTYGGGANGYGTVFRIAGASERFAVLASFDTTDGSAPYAGLIQGTDGNFYGTAAYHGANGDGAVFNVTPAGTLTALHSFNGTDGDAPWGSLVLGMDGNYYGTTFAGGANLGTVFQITAGGTLTTLHSFNGNDGSFPNAGLIQAADGNFYGTTSSGGANSSSCQGYSCGTVFKITAAGALTTLYSFCSKTNCADGWAPIGALVQGTDGNFYGTTYAGGANNSACNGNGCGTVFKITPGGKLTTLHGFCSQSNCADGAEPYAGLVQGIDGNFYGTTVQGGALNDGTVFKITAAGTLTTLYSFCSQTNCTDGSSPRAGLIQATDGYFYGTTQAGGAGGGSGDGTVFRITAKGVLTTLHSFDCTDGCAPYSGLLQGTDGGFYGTTSYGGANWAGAVFSLGVGLGQFVKTQPTSGYAGTAVMILGDNLAGTTKVEFNGMPADFTVVTNSEIMSSVPPWDVTTGSLSVVSPSGTLKSNVIFRVEPQIYGFSPPSGPVGTEVVITGLSLTQTKTVTLGGVKTTDFIVNADGQVTVYVPSGAKTGHIAITTSGGAVTSSGIFTVK